MCTFIFRPSYSYTRPHAPRCSTAYACYAAQSRPFRFASASKTAMAALTASAASAPTTAAAAAVASQSPAGPQRAATRRGSLPLPHSSTSKSWGVGRAAECSRQLRLPRSSLAVPLTAGLRHRATAPPSAAGRRLRVVASAASSAAGSPAPEGDNSTAALVRSFTNRRLFVFFSIVVGYSCYYLTRNSLGVVSPLMVASPDLNLDVIQVGAITSIFPICYGMSKFVSGVVGDLLSPRYMLCVGLFATGCINVAFGFGSTLAWFCTFWALNGLFQGFGAPSCAKIISAWFATKERGTYWGLWNIAHNLGGALAPILAGTAAAAFGWRYGLWAPGIDGIDMGIFHLTLCRATPKSIGIPSSETVFAEKVRSGQHDAAIPTLYLPNVSHLLCPFLRL